MIGQAYQRAYATSTAEAQDREVSAQATRDAAAAAVEATRTARRCTDPLGVAVNATLRWEDVAGGRLFWAFVSGTARNTCNYPAYVRLEVTGLALNGTIIETTTVPLFSMGPGEERSFSQRLAQRDRRDITSIRIVPR